MSDNGNISKFAVDGMTPERVMRPTSLEQLSAELALAHAAGEAVIPWGGGTRMHVGNLPERYTVALDMTGFSGLVQHEPGDMTLFAHAGVTIAKLQKTLERSGQRLPFDVANPERATLGGSVASNAGGQIRSSLGGIRDWVIGMKVVLADGTVSKSGGRVVKNVQGYDLHRLHTGAFGTLAVIAEVALKVGPIAPETSTIAAWFETISDAGDFTMQVFNGPVQPDAMTLFVGDSASHAISQVAGDARGDAQVLVLSKVAGGPNAVSRMESDLTGAAGALGAVGYDVIRDKDEAKLWQTATEIDAEVALSARATLKPKEALRYLESVNRSIGDDGLSGELQAGFGTVSISIQNPDREKLDVLRAAAAEHGGQAVIEHCLSDLKKEIDVFGESGDALELMRSVKQRFDPQRVLSPGRFAGSI